MKFRSLESLRGIAALIVVLFHTPFIDGTKFAFIGNGKIFVDFFFILSGFVMAFAYLHKIKEGFEIKRFTLLRFGRLYPLHLFILLIWVPYIFAKAYAFHVLNMGVNDPFVAHSFYTFFTNLLLIHSLGLHDSLTWNTASWSICVEFFTYLIFYAVIFVAKNNFKTYHAFLISIASYYALYLLSDDTLLMSYDYGLLRGVGGFFIGIVIFDLYRLLEKNISSLQNSKTTIFLVTSVMELLVVGIVIYLVAISFQDRVMQLGTFALFGIVILLFAVQSHGIISRILNTRIMTYIGTLSYSIYMVHLIVYSVSSNIWEYVLKLPTKPLVVDGISEGRYFDTEYASLINLALIIIIIGISHLTYSYVESPWRDRFRKLSTETRRPEKNKV